MRKRGNDRLVMLVEAVMGERPLADLGPLTPGEAERLRQLGAVADVLRGDHFVPPESLLRSAKGIHRGPSVVPMRIAGSSLQPSGARAAGADSIHVAYEHGEDRARAMFVREPDGWRVIGQAPGPRWSIVCGDVVAETDEMGRFEVTVRASDAPSVLLVGNGQCLLLDPPNDVP
jgi:hypothetical protein